MKLTNKKWVNVRMNRKTYQEMKSKFPDESMPTLINISWKTSVLRLEGLFRPLKVDKKAAKKFQRKFEL